MTQHGHACRFNFNGQTVTANDGQTIAGALHNAGRHILSRSFKYHRPRGLFCVNGRCPNCLCTVNGVPNVRICTTTAQPDMQVRAQNAWPSVDHDFLEVLDRMDHWMPVGFYYKSMHRPRWMWPIFERFIRRVAGLGSVDRLRGAAGSYDKLNLFTDIAVVGAGWAGLHAALEVAQAGATVTLIDDQPALGGHLRYDPDLIGDEPINSLVETVTSHPDIHIISSALAFGCYEQNYLGIQQGKRLIRLRAQAVVIATGGWERPFVFENNDLPGNLLASGAQRLVHLDGCRLNGPVLVVTDNRQGYRAARQLGATTIVDLRADSADDGGDANIHRGHTIVSAHGRRHVRSASIAPIGGGSTTTIPCQWIVQAVGFVPATGLLYQNGCKLVHDQQLDHPRVQQYHTNTYSAGAVNGDHDIEAAALDGRRAGLNAAAQCVAILPADLEEKLRPIQDALTRLEGMRESGGGHYVSHVPAKKKFVCLCEDVTERDIANGVDEGFSNIETLKRYSTVSMGPCQGKMCQAAAVALCARANGQSIQQTGTTTARPPEQPVPLGVLAGKAVQFTQLRRTPIHHWHMQAGAKFLDAGNWKRPESYTTPADEYSSVRKRAGIIDVSTLGKIELRGTDVVEFLEFVYPNRFANLKMGRVRYGVVCDEAGIILDDGTIGRLGEQRYFLTTTTGNADAVDSWFRWWLTARPQLDVQLINVSANYAAMNLAGPRSREILQKLTDADISTDALPYLAVGQFKVAGVDAIVLRIGFVGELGYEIHVPTQYGMHVWNALLGAGDGHGLKPFGVEAQRMLRLDKKHLLPGVDTDALSNPLEADLPWIVKTEKEDFLGKWSLASAQQRGNRTRLVGIRMSNAVVPEDYSLVMHRGKLGGRITSCRYSPAIDATIGLAWVPAETSKNGDVIEVLVEGTTFTAVVQDEPFYDPDGEKLRS